VDESLMLFEESAQLKRISANYASSNEGTEETDEINEEDAIEQSIIKH
jgi:hypothetical protein